jgi:hypothetical protein
MLLVKESIFQLFLDFWAQSLDYITKGLSPLARPSNPPRAKKGIPCLQHKQIKMPRTQMVLKSALPELEVSYI